MVDHDRQGRRAGRRDRRFHVRRRLQPAHADHPLEEPSRLAWECVAGHEPWSANTFRFELTGRDGGGTSLLFRQEYAQELSDVQYGVYNFNWGYYLESLRRYCDTGQGAPYAAE